MQRGASNSNQRAYVERIVREVLAELVQAPANHRAPPAANGELKVTASVVSAKELEGRLKGVSQVVLSRGAVITPSARDLLNERRIAIASAAHASGESTGLLLIARAATSFDIAGLADMLTKEGHHVERTRETQWIDAVEGLAQRVAGGEFFGLLFTEQAAASLCLTNRRRGVRAALGADSAGVAAAADMAPNLLVIDPRGKSLFEMRQIVLAWRRGPSSCSTALVARLDRDV